MIHSTFQELSHSMAQVPQCKLEIVDPWTTRIPHTGLQNSNKPCDLDLWPIDMEMILDTLSIPSWVVLVPHMMNIIHQIGNKPQSGHGMRWQAYAGMDGRTEWNQYPPPRNFVLLIHWSYCSLALSHPMFYLCPCCTIGNIVLYWTRRLEGIHQHIITPCTNLTRSISSLGNEDPTAEAWLVSKTKIMT